MQLDEIKETRRLMVVDDHPIIEQGLKIFLESYPDIELVGTAQDGKQGLKLLREKNPDVILLDLAMPGIDGIEAIRLYLTEKPDVNILVFSGMKKDVYVYQALEAGAHGYVLKGSPISKIIEAIREVGQGGFWLSPEVNYLVFKSFVKGKQREPGAIDNFKSLTQREQQVFRLLAQGKSTTEVADILCISPKTVAKHRVAVKTKLKLNNVAEMANYAASIGLNLMQ